jgi:predicted nucleic acid-binding protein
VSVFFDTNIIIYAQQPNAKGAVARGLLAKGGVVSVQVFNEFASVSHRKFGRSWAEIAEAINDIVAVTQAPVALSLDLHAAARTLAEQHRLSFYDALIVAAAIDVGCDTLLSEDLQHGRRFGKLVIQNPFVGF